MNIYPLMLDLADRLTVVVGGGPVGARRAASLLEAGARVKIVCLEPPEFPLSEGKWRGFGERAHWTVEPYHATHLDGACLVFAAALPAVNVQVVADAKRLGIWVNSADDPETGDFLVPSLVRRGDLHIAVSTGGAAPFVARRLREWLEEQLDESWAGWLDIHRELRFIVQETISNAEARRALFEKLADLDWLRRYRLEGHEAVFLAMRQVVEEATR